MAWFGRKKKKTRKKTPVLEPVGANTQAIPSVQAVPAQAPPIVQNNVPPIQDTNQVVPLPAVQEPIIEIAPVGIVPDANIVVSNEFPSPVQASATAPLPSTGWSKKSEKPLGDIHKKLDYMMDSKGKSLEERYKERFGDKLPDSVVADNARKEFNEMKELEKEKPKIVFRSKSQLKLKSKTVKTAPKEPPKEGKVTTNVNSPGMGAKIGSGIKTGGAKTKAAFGRAGSAVGRGAGAIKSGVGRGTSRFIGLFKRGKKEDDKTKKTLKKDSKTKTTSKKRGRPPKKKIDYSSMKLTALRAELKKKGLPTSGNKANLIKRLTK